MRWSYTSLVALSLAMSFGGCTCPSGVTYGTGEVSFVMPNGTVDVSGLYEFNPTPMGTSNPPTLSLTVRNTGPSAFTITSFVKVDGSPIRLGEEGDASPVFTVVYAKDTDVRSADEVPFTITFTPPVTPNVRFVDYETKITMKTDGADVAESTIVIRGKATPGECELPSLIDFGAVSVRDTAKRRLPFENNGLVDVVGSANPIGGADSAAFLYDAESATNDFAIEPSRSKDVVLAFSPTETREYVATVKLRRAASCPAVNVRLKGRGVTSCLSWKAEPSLDVTQSRLDFGYYLPMQVGQGKITFINFCGLPIDLAEMRTTDAWFAISDPPMATTLNVPAGAPDMVTGMWVDGKAELKMEFRPTALGAKSGNLNASTSSVATPSISVPLKGVGGGPDIDVRPAPTLNFGRIAYFPGAATPSYSQRNLVISNVGTRPTPADARANLELGSPTMSGVFWTVRALQGDLSEICVGKYDATAQTPCTNAPLMGTGGYNPMVGIEASAASALAVPVRLIPTGVGPREYEITIFSNDIDEPEVKITVHAEAQTPPPCNFEIAPTQLNFGVVAPPVSKDLTFTVRNRGTAPEEMCYFNGFEMVPGSNSAFSVPNPADPLELMPNSEATVVVRAAPTQMPMGISPIEGDVGFNVSNPTMPRGNVHVLATLAPSCLTITPAVLDFGRVEQDCPSPDRIITVLNSCSMPVGINSYRLPASSTVAQGTGACTTMGGCSEFVVVSVAPGFVGNLAPGASKAISLKYHPYNLGADTGSFAISATQSGQNVDYVVPMKGNADVRADASQCSVQATCPAPKTSNPNSTVTLTPNVQSFSGAISCLWSVVSRPSTANGAFGNPTSCTTSTYFADVVGTHILRFTVTDATGHSTSCDTSVTVVPLGDLWVELTWDRNNDMDLHLLHPNAGAVTNAGSWGGTAWDCHFRSHTPSWDNPGTADDPSLDRDDIPGRGPENIRINSPSRAHGYTVGVHMYSWSASPTPVTSTVKIYCGGQLVATQVRTIGTDNDMWIVGQIDYSIPNSSACMFTPDGRIVPNVP